MSWAKLEVRGTLLGRVGQGALIEGDGLEGRVGHHQRALRRIGRLHDDLENLGRAVAEDDVLRLHTQLDRQCFGELLARRIRIAIGLGDPLLHRHARRGR